MRIENKRNLYKIWLLKLASTIVFAGIVAVLLIFDLIPKESVFTKYHALIAVSILFILFNLIRNLRKPYYLYFSDNSDVLIFKFYQDGLVKSRKNSVQIPKQHFIKYETKKFFLGLEEQIILYQKYRNKIAKYPPISLSAVDKKDREDLKLALNTYSQKS